MRRFTLKAATLAGVLLGSALIPAMAQQSGPGLVGDVNGDGRITSADALAVYAFLAGRPVPATFDIPGRGDADGDGRITRADAELIMRVAVGQAAPDRPVGKPSVAGSTPAAVPTRLQCVADVRSGSVSCADPSAGTNGVAAEALTYSGQHINVELLTSNVTVAADTFAFDMRVRNMIPQPIGTSDGTTVDGVMVFLSNGVQANGGTVGVMNNTGAAPFTTSEPQKYFTYPEIIQPQAVSSSLRWKLHLDPSVTGFSFYLYINASVPHPKGYVDVYPDSAVLSAGATLQLSDTVRSAFGKVIPGETVTWASSNPAVATVNASGIVTAVADGTVQITASNAPRASGSMTLTVSTAALDSSTVTASPATLAVHDTSRITVQLRSGNGTPITRSGGAVVLAASAGTLSGVTDNGNGTYSATLTHASVGTSHVSATLNGAALPDTADVIFTAGAAAGYRVTASADTVAAGGNVTITAQTVDADGNAVSASGTTVTWSSTNGGTFAQAASTTNASGAATVVFTTSTTAGTTHTVSATDGTLSGTSGNILASVGAASKLVITQQPTNVTAGSAITPAVQVSIQDANGNVVTSSSDTVTIAIGNNPSSGVLSGTMSVAAVNGVATFSNLSINRSGTGYTLAASSGSLTGATSSAFNVSAGSSSQLAITTQAADTARSGTAFTRQPVLQLRDANGNAVAQAGVQVTAAIATGGGTLGGTTTALTDASGVATFTNLSIAGTAGGRTLSFSAAGLTGATSGTVTVTAGTASALEFTQQPSSVTAGAAITPAVRVSILDAAGNLVTGATNSVTVAFATNPSSGTLAGTTTVAAVNGVATFSNLSINKSGTGYTLAATAGSLAVDTSSTFTVTAGAAARLVITTQPSDTVHSGETFARQPVLRVEDGFGNRVSQAGIRVAASVTSGRGSANGDTAVVTDASGVATFTNLAIGAPVGTETITFASAGLTSAVSAPMYVAPVASLLTFQVQPSTTAAGASITPSVKVAFTDAQGNVVTNATGSITLELASNPGSATLSGTLTVTPVNGVATFAGLSLNRAGGYSLRAYSGALAGVSAPFTVTAGAASQLTLTTQPSDSAQSGTAFARQPVAQLRDANGNPVSQAGVTVTAAIATGGGTLGGTATATTDAAGAATFTDLRVTGTPGSRTLSFSATGLTGATSSTVAVTAGAASQLALTTQPSTTAQAGVAFAQQPVIQLRDASGNPVAQAGVTVTAAIATGGGTLGGTATATTDAAGAATFTNLSIGGTAGARTLSFSATGLTGAASDAVTVSAGTAAALAFTTQPSDATAGTAISPAVQVTIRDAYGNTVAGATSSVTIGIASNPAGGVLSGTKTVAAVNGIATFSDLSIGQPSAGYTLAVTSGSLTGATSNAFTVSPAAAVIPDGTLLALDCTANVTGIGSLTCDAIAGSENAVLTTSNITLNTGARTFSFDATIQNLLKEAIGTPDGVITDTAGVEAYFASVPSNATVINATGQKDFGSGARPYFRYLTKLTQNQVSAAQTWQLTYASGATTVNFRVYVRAEVQPLLVINELGVNPGGTIADANGEYVELYNAGSLPVQMQGLVFADSAASGRRPFNVFTASYTVAPGGYIVLGNTTNTTSNGGVPVDYAYGGAMSFANSLDAFKISRVYGTDTLTIDRTQYASAAVSAQDGISRELKNPALDNSNMDGSNWGSASVTSVLGAWGRGTPKAQNSSYTPNLVPATPGPVLTAEAPPRTSQ